MRVRLKGINRVAKRLADGTVVTYYYAWKGGPPLRGEPGTPEFIASDNEALYFIGQRNLDHGRAHAIHKVPFSYLTPR